MTTEEILKYEKLVYSIINKFLNYADKDDLYQAGMMALMEAYKRYDNKNNSAKFSTYAYFYIIGEVTKFIREDKSFKISRELIRVNKLVEKARDLLRQKLQREPNDDELALYLNIDINFITRAKEACEVVKSLDEVVSCDDNRDYYNSVKSYDKNTSSEIMDLNNELEKLDDFDKKIIYYRYYMGYSQSEISKNMGISQVQVSRKENKILQKLKTSL